ncbi:MAG: lipoate--protein ligase [Clostridia bacterium]|nr:lipoate--protein ligase [Clostridia bacterium]
MINKLSVYVSESFNVYRNLATEKYLFDTVGCDEIILYLWQNENTAVIGRNQNAFAECNTTFAKERHIAIARRLSGGGAVYHDLGNLNFTFISDKNNLDVTKNMLIIADACNMAGIETTLSGRNDILCNDRKFSGNAFYNSGEKAYHHGTIMINCDTEKMQKILTPSLEKLASKGVKSVKSRVMNLSEVSPSLTCEQMKEYLISCFEKHYGKKAFYIKDVDKCTVSTLADEYSKYEYVFAKSPVFSFSAKGRFAWGSIEIMPKVKNGFIDSITIFSDSLIWQLPDIIKNTLCGCKFSGNDVTQKLCGALGEDMAKDIAALLFKSEV